MSQMTGLPSLNEIRVLRALVRHGTMRAAARALGVSQHCIDSHLDHLRVKSGLRYLPQLVAWAAVHGWLGDDLPPEATWFPSHVANSARNAASRRSRSSASFPPAGPVT